MGSDRTADSRPMVMLVMLAAFGAGTVGSGRCGVDTGSAEDGVRGSVSSLRLRGVRASAGAEEEGTRQMRMLVRVAAAAVLVVRVGSGGGTVDSGRCGADT